MVAKGRTKVAELDDYTLTWTTPNPAIARLRALPKDVQKSLDDTSHAIAERTADHIRAVAFGDDGQSRLVAPSVAASLTGTPAVLAAGRARIPGRRATYSDVFYGANFGGYDFPQFRAPLGDKQDYWFFDTFYAESPSMMREWAAAIDALAEAFGDGDDGGGA